MDRTLEYIRRVRAAMKALQTPADVEMGKEDGFVPDFTIEPLEVNHDLTMFRLMVGIYQDKSFRTPAGFSRDNRPVVSTTGRPSPNIGIYPSVCDNELKAKRSFKNFSFLINLCLGLQLVVAAALTAIGASGAHRGPVTAFGALNTVIAGFLTFLKGSGLPNRYKYYQNQWGKVREYIEQKERDLAMGRITIDLDAEVGIIRQMYEDIRADVEANTPERFLGSSANVRSQIGINPPPAAYVNPRSNDDRSMEQRLMGMLSNLENKGKTWLHDKEKAATATVTESVRQTSHGISEEVLTLRANLEAKMKEIQAMERKLHEEKQRRVQATTDEIRDITNHTIREVSNLEHDVENRVAAAVQQRQTQLHEATRNYVDEKLGPANSNNNKTQ